MKPRISVITIGVDDLERALEFYRDGLGFPTEGIVGEEFDNGAVAFFDFQQGLKIAIWKRQDIAHETNTVMAHAEQAGALITDPAHDTFWGGYSGHFQDPDGHLWEVVWNPAWGEVD